MANTIFEALQNLRKNLVISVGDKAQKKVRYDVAVGQLTSIIDLLEKGYSAEDLIEPLINKYGSIENVPRKEPESVESDFIYEQEAIRTEPYYHGESGPERRLQDIAWANASMSLLHGSMGVVTEAGELMDAIKKHVFYGKPLDYPNVLEEIGDIQWYCVIICNALGTTLEKVQRKNIEKLKARFPEKFTEENALNRDLQKEREILEND